ncbi:Hypothetical Protein FCC1311_097012 [Hondaea fermentalgiana]|uniref:Pyrrolo-quinoline quinone repeat domain-containing protein n=1 Tax=Hondaea fermentalgiana TaxID=2315210 RepID=A0A2R5GUP5_9STRA|nr:Hypothetical Protein FCC1311_097012 [Hondaea fermentalgiana]|eukprot:GBG33478.1 Hypothetical Protein FCC1311_097012 [Hondaea fermentalgiana]
MQGDDRRRRIAVIGVAALAAIAYATGEACTEEQLACVSSAQEALDAIAADASDREGAACLDFTDAYAQLASCVGATGCDDADLSDNKASCLDLNVTESDCLVDCSAIANSLSAVSDTDDEEAFSYPEYGNGTLGIFPSATYNGRQSTDALQTPANGGSPGEDFKSLFTYDDAEGVAGSAPVETTAGEFVFNTADGILVCVNAAGDTVWDFSPLDYNDEGVSFVGQPVITSRGDVIVGDDAGMLYRLDETSGEVVSMHNLGGAITATPVASRDYVFVSSRGTPGVSIPSVLHKISIVSDEETDAGLEIWRRPVCDHVDTRLDWPDTALALTNDAGIVVVCAWTGYVDIIEADAGDLRSSTLIADTSGSDSVSTPALYGPALVDADDGIYVTAPGGDIYKLASDGSSDFSVAGAFADDVEGALALNSDAGMGYALGNTGVLYSFSLDDGSIAQQLNFSDTAQNVNSGLAPAIDASGNIVIALGSEIVVLDSSLQEVSRVDVGASVLASPSIAQGTVLAATEDSALALTGAEALAVATAAPTNLPPPAPPVPTSSPTKATASPTPSKEVGGNNGDDEGEDKDNGWPTSAIAVVSILAVLDACLLGAVGTKAYQRKNSVGGDAKMSKNIDDMEDAKSMPPNKSPPTSAPSSPGAAPATADNQVAQA